MSSNLEKIKEYLPFEDLVELFFDLFNKEYGEAKADEIVSNIQRSNKANRFLADSLYSQKRYPPISFVTVINTGRFFLFKKPEVICYASLILLVKWELTVGSKIDLINKNGLPDEIYLKKMLFSIIAESEKQKTHISGTPGLFNKYNKILLDLQDDLANLVESENENIEEVQDNEEYFIGNEQADEKDDGNTNEDIIEPIKSQYFFLPMSNWNNKHTNDPTGHYKVEGRKFCKKHLIPFNSSGRCPFC